MDIEKLKENLNYIQAKIAEIYNLTELKVTIEWVCDQNHIRPILNLEGLIASEDKIFIKKITSRNSADLEIALSIFLEDRKKGAGNKNDDFN